MSLDRIVGRPRMLGRGVDPSFNATTKIPVRNLLNRRVIADECEQINHDSNHVARFRSPCKSKIILCCLHISSTKSTRDVPSLSKNTDLGSTR